MSSLNFDHLLKLRVAVARVGEMDLAKWWNTKGQLGRLGSAALRRGFPRTHHFAQARSVFAVASHRCDEVFNPPKSVTLWRLPEDVEEAFDARWEHWLDHASDWTGFFERISGLGGNLSEALLQLELVNEADLKAARSLRRSSGSNAIQLPRPFDGSDEQVRLLACAFVRGEPGELVVPYALRGEG